MPYTHKLSVLKLTKINDWILHRFYETETQIFHLPSFSPTQIHSYFVGHKIDGYAHTHIHTHVGSSIHVHE